MPRGVNTQDEGRIQGRNVVNANSSNIVSPGIVTDGLVLHLDAGNYESYPIAGTTWYDLSGRGNNGTLTTGQAYILDGGGAIDFDGTDDIVSGVISVRLPSNFSIEFFIKRDGNLTDFCSILSIYDPLNPGPAIGSLQIDFGTVTATNTLRVVQENTQIVSDTSTISDNTWTYFCITRNNTVYNIFRNGQFVATGTNTPDITGTGFYIGRNRSTTSARFFSGAVSFVRFYSTALSSPEINQNFNATRARFNI